MLAEDGGSEKGAPLRASGLPLGTSSRSASGGADTVFPVWGIIFKPWADEPIFHAVGDDPLHTACGRPIGMTTPGFPLKHARKFGKPCRGCFSR